MSKKHILRIPDYLGHIVEAIERIHRYVEDMDEVSFLDDEKTQDAVIRNFEIIGEASRNIERYHPAYAESHAEVEHGNYPLPGHTGYSFKVDYRINCPVGFQYAGKLGRIHLLLIRHSQRHARHVKQGKHAVLCVQDSDGARVARVNAYFHIRLPLALFLYTGYEHPPQPLGNFNLAKIHRLQHIRKLLCSIGSIKGT